MLRRWLLKPVLQMLEEIKQEVRIMAEDLKDTYADLDAEDTAIATLVAGVTTILADVTELLNKPAGSVDTTAENTRIKGQIAQMQALAASLQAGDTSVNPPAPPATPAS